ncbi:hypothetical protein Fmac_021592 [Flemingia macrophylla]|uniref:O-methyltransferase C-terminal domain-containing protein n=1 Tax=Flemingia macrophylla TaxID=520843 RepID=A0ABD1LXD6_9FABA
MPLSQLIASLPIHPSKTSFIYRLMRILTHNGFFTHHNAIENEQEVNEVIEKCMSIEVFKGLESLVDVGGGTGTTAKPTCKEYVSGDMFEAIPSADCIMLKNVLHDWNEEESIKILDKFKQAIPSHGKVIIIEIVMEHKPEAETAIGGEQYLLFDMIMTTFAVGKKRSEKEWANLILSTGFNNYKITPTSGLLSIIEVYP